MTSATLELDGRRVELTSLDKELWPEARFTKGDMIEYYRRVAPALLPHVARRPLTLGRFPNGVRGRGFAQTECRGRPDWLATHPIRIGSGVVRRFCLVNDLPSLLWVANLNTIELHPFLSRADEPERPLVVAFDLDPEPPATFSASCEVALALRRALDARGLRSFAKTSGSAGIHVYVPLNTPVSYADTKAFARAVADALAREFPDRVAARMTRKAARAGMVLVDWLQNDPTRSTVAPYSLRAGVFPTVSTPVGWDEVERAADGGRDALVFAADDVLRRLTTLGDLFAPVLETEQTLPRVA